MQRNPEIEFGDTIIRCSSLYYLFMEPKTKAAKEAGELSETAKSHLISTYIWQKYGRRKDVSTPQIEKGRLVEAEAIAMAGRVHGVEYIRNDERRSNGYISGETDVSFPVIVDVKSSWDVETFLTKVKTGLDPLYEHQVKGYMWLWDQPIALVCYCLISTPEVLLNAERKKLFYAMDCVTEEDNRYVRSCAEMEYNLVFDDIPEEERVISFEIERDEELIAQIPGRVQKARDYLVEFAKDHQKFIDKCRKTEEIIVTSSK